LSWVSSIFVGIEAITVPSDELQPAEESVSPSQASFPITGSDSIAPMGLENINIKRIS
jgi:hypothetical protein